MSKKEAEQFYPTSKEAWREWLQENHQKKEAVWLVYYKAKSGKASLSWSDAVDEALCFGWIDSTHKSIDNEQSIQFFTKRKARSTWSKVNKDKVELFIKNGKMTQAGLAAIEIAKKNGSWTSLDEVEALIIPTDLEAALAEKPDEMAVLQALGKSAKKSILHRLALAKLPETRQKRIAEALELLSGLVAKNATKKEI